MHTGPRHRTAATLAVTLLLVTAAVVPLGVGATPSPSPSSSPLPLEQSRYGPTYAPASTDERAGTSTTVDRTVTLVTGQPIRIVGTEANPAIRAVDGSQIRIVRFANRTYVFPADVDLITYDRSLFRLETLLERGADDPLPVLLDANASVASAPVPGLDNARYLDSADVVAADLDPATAAEPLAQLVAEGRVQSVSFDGAVETVPVSPSTASQLAGRSTLTGAGVRIAVLDTGVDATHPDLNGSVVDRVDFVEPNGTDAPLDPNGHGTVVAGLAAGSGIANASYAGVAPGADLIDVRVMDERGRAPASRIIEGIEYAVEADADLIQISIGTSVDGSESIAESVQWATERGVVVVAAAGNLGRPRTIGAPGRPVEAITVGAADASGGVATYSSRGPTLAGNLKPDLVAPGTDTVGPLAAGSGRVPVDEAGRYTRMGGTSAATPQVTGAAALLLERSPGLSASALESRLVSAARPLPGDPVNAQGGGRLDIERTLDPAVVAEPGVIDFGLIESGGTHTRTIELTNEDDRRHDLAFDVSALNVDLDRRGEVATLNRTRLSLAPGETAAITLAVDGNVTSGAYAGAIRYRVDGAPRSLPFGFTRGGTVTVEKHPLTPGDRVDGDELWVLNEQGTHDELLEFENGTARFVAGGGTYVVWSGGVDDATGTTVFLSSHRRFDGPTRVILDERETVPVGVDASPLVERYGPLANRSVTVSMSTPFGDDLARRSIERRAPDSRVVRVSPDADVAVATEYLLASDGRAEPSLDVPDVFHLVHAVERVDGPSHISATPDRLRTTTYRYHRRTVDETYRIRPQASVRGVWNERTFEWYELGRRTDQRVHRLAGVATYHPALSGTGWAARLDGVGEDEETVGVLVHPMLALADVTAGPNGTASVAATPFTDGVETRFDPAGEHTLTALVDGEVVADRRVRDGAGGLDGIRVGPNESLTVRLAGENADGFLSTRTLTEVRVPSGDVLAVSRPGVRDRPPTITDLSIPEANASNAIAPGDVTIAVDADVVGPMATPTVWYATGAPDAPPWRNRSAWTAARIDERGDRLTATVPVPASAETVSLAAEVGDIWGRRTRTMTTDAVHVGRAPNTSTRMIRGQILEASGRPAAGDTVYLDPTHSEILTPVRTDGSGRFAVEVPRTRTYDLVYSEGEPWRIDATPGDGVPAWYPIQRVSPTEDVDLGEVRLPRAGRLDVSVRDERGLPVPGVSVTLRQRGVHGTVSERLSTGADGRAKRAGAAGPGIDVAGEVEITVRAPSRPVYPPQTVRVNRTVDGAVTQPVTLETTPPTAVLTAMGPIGPRRVVLLQAWDSRVPAGAVEYRWDVDGDGEIDEVTTRPLARYELADGGVSPAVTVVDRAGKTDTARLTLRNVSTG